MNQPLKIVAIKHVETGEDRTDGRYPLRVECVGTLVRCEIGTSAIFQYISNADGAPKSGYLVTSAVEAIDWPGGGISLRVTTLNSIYDFAEKEAAHDE